MLSVYVVWWYILANFKPIFAYRQTVWTLIRLLLTWVHTICKNDFLKSQADDKAGDNCGDWQFKCQMHLFKLYDKWVGI